MDGKEWKWTEKKRNNNRQNLKLRIREQTDTKGPPQQNK
jgi:hypothetical protein